MCKFLQEPESLKNLSEDLEQQIRKDLRVKASLYTPNMYDQAGLSSKQRR